MVCKELAQIHLPELSKQNVLPHPLDHPKNLEVWVRGTCWQPSIRVGHGTLTYIHPKENLVN